MIIIKSILHHSSGAFRTEIGEIKIINDGTGTKDKGNYVVTFKNKGKEEKNIEVKNFDRELDYTDLLYEALKKLKGK